MNPGTPGEKEQAADAACLRERGISLRGYLAQEIGRHRSDCDLAREFKVSRHTIKNWCRHQGIQRVQRVIKLHKETRP